MPRFRWKNVNYLRKSLQIIILGLLAYMVVRTFTNPSYMPDYEAYCPLGGMQALASFSVSDTLACSMTSMQIALGVLVLLGVVVFSKLFCGYVCPVGTLTEWLGKLGEKMKMRITITGFADRILRSLKYALLFLTFYFTVEASELFCRQWDPYYAAFTGFSSDVNMLYAWGAIAVLVLGSVFVRQFWCKYLCPLGAATNIFAMIVVPLVVLAAWIALYFLGVSLHWIGPLAAVCFVGFLYEAVRMQTAFAPLTVIQRVDAICTSCRKCDRACPMAIEVSTAGKVRHIDCHLCTDCIQACPEKGALTINRKDVPWFPSLAAVALVAGGLWLGSAVELPTITEKWGNETEMATAKIYEQSGLRSIKCFGSSSSFATRMKQVPGVLGVQTFVGRHTVKIWYDTSTISESGVREAMFTPMRKTFEEPDGDNVKVGRAVFAVEKLFDSYDHLYFETLLHQLGGVYAVETRFGEPVTATIYYNPDVLDSARIVAQFRKKSVIFMQNGSAVSADVDFKAAAMKSVEFLRGRAYRKAKFVPQDWTFNGYDATATYEVYEIAIPEALDAKFAGEIPYLISHMSNDTGTVRFITALVNDVPVARIYFKPSATSARAIYARLRMPRLHILYEEGDSEDVPNKFAFRTEGIIRND